MTLLKNANDYFLVDISIIKWTIDLCAPPPTTTTTHTYALIHTTSHFRWLCFRWLGGEWLLEHNISISKWCFVGKGLIFNLLIASESLVWTLFGGGWKKTFLKWRGAVRHSGSTHCQPVSVYFCKINFLILRGAGVIPSSEQFESPQLGMEKVWLSWC